MKLICALLLTTAAALPAQDTTEWRHYGRDAGGARYSPLRQINRANVQRLDVAWTYHTGEVPQGRSRSFEATPLMIAGRLYLITPLGQVLALDVESGKQIWIQFHSPQGRHPGGSKDVHRRCKSEDTKPRVDIRKSGMSVSHRRITLQRLHEVALRMRG